jgi:hypothetical protein
VSEASLAAMYICSGCYSQHTRKHISVLPTWNESAEDFVTSYRCDGCWDESLAWTRLKALVLTEDTKEKFCQFLERHHGGEPAGTIRRAPLDDAEHHVGTILNCIAEGTLVLGR